MNGVEEISMPFGSEPLSVQAQGDTLTVWAIVDPDARVPEFNRKQFMKICTGVECSQMLLKYRFLGTVQHPKEKYVIHVFTW
jgi:hypothetical protein